MKSVAISDIELQHVAVGVSARILPPVSIVTLETTAANLPKPHVARFSVRLTLINTVEIAPVSLTGS